MDVSRVLARVVAGCAVAVVCVACASPAPERAPQRVAETLPERGAGEADGGASSFIRVNQLGYTPDRDKVAVVCSLEAAEIDTFSVEDADGRVVFGPAPARRAPGFGPCATTHRLDFSDLTEPGTYRVRARVAAGEGGVVASDVTSPPVRVGPDVYHGAADFLLRYMRQQRSGYNPFYDDSVHHRTDAILVDHERAGEFIPVAGGWADAADYLQYGTTSANATFNLLAAARDHPESMRADGRPGANGVPDVLDEARHGLEWVLRMLPEADLLLHQIGDDRDHAFPDLLTSDSSDYGWGKGSYRPVYACTGQPQGLFEHRNRSDGKASIAGKYAAAFALGARMFRGIDAGFARQLEERAFVAYEIGREYPGVCQTAPGVAPYFYEEDNWVDDMELAAAQLHALTADERYLREAMEYARKEPVTPWMGQDTARHYQWFPWHNPGHYETWRTADPRGRETLASFYRRGLEAVAERADNGFLIGVPFIWCSNNLMTSFATQALLYHRMTGDDAFQHHQLAAFDWLFGTNPWGTSMVIGLPEDGVWARDPHSIAAMQIGVETQFGGLLDGPVYSSIYDNLLYINLHEPDEYAAFNTGRMVYHDDQGDYSTNEPIMDGTANLAYLVSALSMGR
ncbi:MAG TPA: glycoside hydrolase family 9 protein, partial [Longimicrobiales bacterium]|nr:glycoside hydrolase family 9 protein [Longimicrobiales bacterium]